MRFLGSLLTSLALAAFVLVLIASVAATLGMMDNRGPEAAGVGALAGGCVIAAAILIHGAITRPPDKE